MIVGFSRQQQCLMPIGGKRCGLIRDGFVEMGVRPGMVVVDLCCGDGLFTAPLARIVDSVYATTSTLLCWIARGRLLLQLVRQLPFFRGGRYDFRCGRAGAGRLCFPRKYFHGVPDQLGLARTVVAISNRKGNSGSSIGIVALVKETWSSGSLADRGPRCGWKPAMSR